jgi:ribonuclease P protein component
MQQQPETHTFSRSERLKSARCISDLFTSGHAYVAYPIRVVWMPMPDAVECIEQAQVAFSVPKRAFKKATARNRIKRQMREAYRLHKLEWYTMLAEKQVKVAFMMTYIAKEPLPFKDIENGVRKMIRKFGQ